MDWINKHKKEIVFTAIIFLVATISFAFGYLLAEKEGRAPIIIQQREELRN